jgi:hypothetical protein
MTFIELETPEHVYHGVLLERETGSDGQMYYTIQISLDQIVCVPASEVRAVNFFGNIVPFPGRVPNPE